MDWTQEAGWRLVIFIVIFSSLSLMELLAPRGKKHERLWQRRGVNLAMVVADSLLLRLVFPMAAVGIALWVESQELGLFNFFDAPFWLACLLSFLILDLAIWFGHWASHHIPLFWRVHRVHHSDIDLDVTSALRFHPIEILASMLWKAVIILLLGAPALAVFIFEVVLNGCAMFNHANIRIPKKLDRLLRCVVVTPDMHRIHHSIIERETNANFGFNLPWWDRLFGTYTSDPQDGQTGMTLGLEEYLDERPTRLKWSFLLPFIKGEK